MKVITTNNLTKRFSAAIAVDGVTFSVKKGELFGLLGPNGSGKTTMIKMLTGQIAPSAGNASVLGLDVAKEPIKVREKVGIIPEQETPPSFLTAEEYLEFVANIRGLKSPDLNHWFSFLDFEDQRNSLCKDLSRGTRQKLMVAQAFLHKPQLAFIDEPLINLDPIIQKKVKDFLKGFVRAGGTVFFSTHVLEIAQEVCTRVAIIHNGKILYNDKNRKGLEKLFLSKVKNA